MASFVYNSAKKFLWDRSGGGGIDWDTDTIRCMLVTATYAASQDNDDYVNDVTNEVAGTGYTAGGAALANLTVTQDNTNDLAMLDANDVTWAASTITARAAVLYKDTGTPATSPLIAYIDFGSNQTSTNGNFTIQWHANGIIRLA